MAWNYPKPSLGTGTSENPKGGRGTMNIDLTVTRNFLFTEFCRTLTNQLYDENKAKDSLIVEDISHNLGFFYIEPNSVPNFTFRGAPK